MSKSKEDVNDSVISVKDWAKRLNKIQSESELQLTSEPNLRRKDITRHVNIFLPVKLPILFFVVNTCIYLY